MDKSSRSLDDNSMTDILERLSPFIGVFDLSDNHFIEMPTLSEYKPLDTVKEVILKDNKIEKFYWQQFPLQTEVIDLSFNELKRLPIFSNFDKCLLVKTLNLYKN